MFKKFIPICMFLAIISLNTLGCSSLSYNLVSVQEAQFAEFKITNTTSKPIDWFVIDVLYENPSGPYHVANYFCKHPVNTYADLAGYLIEEHLEPSESISVFIARDESVIPHSESSRKVRIFDPTHIGTLLILNQQESYLLSTRPGYYGTNDVINGGVLPLQNYGRGKPPSRFLNLIQGH